MKRQIVFISGKYRARTKLGVLWNIYKARRAAIKLWQRGYATICPHLNSALMPGNPDLFLKGDLKILAKCHIIYMLKNWEYSDGACLERLEAQRRGLTVWYEDKPVEIVAMYDPCEYKVEPITSLELQEAGVIK